MKKGESQRLPEVYSLRDVMGRLFDESVWDPFSSFGYEATRSLFPRIDVKETKDVVKVTADVPGIDAENIDIEVKNDFMIISGKQEMEEKHEEENIFRKERYYGEFSRKFMLPARVKAVDVKAKVKNGVLYVELAKADEEKSRKIAIEKG